MVRRTLILLSLVITPLLIGLIPTTMANDTKDYDAWVRTRKNLNYGWME